MTQFLILIIQMFFIPALSPLLVGGIRKVKAILQNRRGASIFQPYRDVRKLFNKDEVISEDASWIFRVTPYLVFSITVFIGACIPLFWMTSVHVFISDLLLVVYLLLLGTFFLALAGIDTGSAFGGFGSSREMTLGSLAEGALIFSLLALAFSSRTTDLALIAENVASLPFDSLLPVALAFFGFATSLLAENARFPFDNPATHLELTMVHEAMILEYSGHRLALVEWASANKLLIFLSLGANVFLPWGIASFTGIVPVIYGLLIYGVKVGLLALAIAFLESSIPKLRFFRLPNLLFTSFILSIIAMGLAM